MEQKNYYVALTYDLKVGQEDELMESTTPENPFTFYTGLGMVLEDFEKAIMACEVNGEFDFTIPAERAYGEYDDESVIDLPVLLLTLTTSPSRISFTSCIRTMWSLSPSRPTASIAPQSLATCP